LINAKYVQQESIAPNKDYRHPTVYATLVSIASPELKFLTLRMPLETYALKVGSVRLAQDILNLALQVLSEVQLREKLNRIVKHVHQANIVQGTVLGSPQEIAKLVITAQSSQQWRSRFQQTQGFTQPKVMTHRLPAL